eukprot:GHVU01075123.1.p1 GENE.GHVU01075123.1~~GHVU01075123.1.p1  ORF type:complete len:389 (+),score=87.00 GHVU01075123.1:27-1169(+)
MAAAAPLQSSSGEHHQHQQQQQQKKTKKKTTPICSVWPFDRCRNMGTVPPRKAEEAEAEADAEAAKLIAMGADPSSITTTTTGALAPASASSLAAALLAHLGARGHEPLLLSSSSSGGYYEALADKAFRQLLTAGDAAAAAAAFVSPCATNAKLCAAWGRTFDSDSLLWCARYNPPLGALGQEVHRVYERLEFLGGCVLAPMISEWLYLEFPAAPAAPLAAAHRVLLSNTYLELKMARRLFREEIQPREALLASQSAWLPDDELETRAHQDSLVSTDFRFAADKLFKAEWEEEEEAHRRGRESNTLSDDLAKRGTTARVAGAGKGESRLAGFYRTMVAATAVDTRFDAHAVWSVIRGDVSSAREEVCDFLEEAGGRREEG